MAIEFDPILGKLRTQDVSAGGSATWGNIIGTLSDQTDLNSALAGKVATSATIAIAHGGTGQTTAGAAFDALSPMTTLGDVIYGGTSGTNTRLAGNTSSTKNFLRQTGTGSVSAAPTWDTVTKTDVGLSSVENTALSTWAGSANITTLGTIGTGTWNATAIAVSKGGTGVTSFTNQQILSSDGSKILQDSGLTWDNSAKQLIVSGAGGIVNQATLFGLSPTYYCRNPFIQGGPLGNNNTADGKIVTTGWRLNLGVGASASATNNADTTAPLPINSVGSYTTVTHVDGGGGAAGHSALVSKTPALTKGNAFSITIMLKTSVANALRAAIFTNITDGTTKTAGTGGTNFGALYGAGQSGTVRTYLSNITSPGSGNYHSGGGTWEYFTLSNFSNPGGQGTGRLCTLEMWMEASGSFSLGPNFVVPGVTPIPPALVAQLDFAPQNDPSLFYRQIELPVRLTGSYVSQGAADIRHFEARPQTHIFLSLTPNWSDLLSTNAGDTGNYAISLGSIGTGGVLGNVMPYTITPNGAGTVTWDLTYTVVATNFI